MSYYDNSEPVGCLQLAMTPFLVLLLVLALVAYLPFWAGDRLRAMARERKASRRRVAEDLVTEDRWKDLK